MITTNFYAFDGYMGRITEKKEKEEEGGGGRRDEGSATRLQGEGGWGGRSKDRTESVVGFHERSEVGKRALSWAKEKLGKVGGLFGEKKLPSVDAPLPSIRVMLLVLLRRESLRTGCFSVDYRQILDFIRQISEELAEAIDERGVRSFKTTGICWWTRYLDWVIAEVKAGRLEKEGEGSVTGCAFAYSKCLTVIERVIADLEAGKKFHQYYFFDARDELEIWDAKVAHGVFDTCTEVAFSAEKKVGFLRDLIEDIEAHVRVQNNPNGTQDHLLRVFSYVIGPERHVVLPRHQIALHAYGAASLSSSSSTDFSSGSDVVKRVRFEVDEVAKKVLVVYGPKNKSFDDRMVQMGLMRPLDETRPRDTKEWWQH